MSCSVHTYHHQQALEHPLQLLGSTHTVLDRELQTMSDKKVTMPYGESCHRALTLQLQGQRQLSALGAD
jgi:hypothetical protein